MTVILYGFCGGLITGASGLGGGIIFSTVFLSLGTPPVVAKASSLYLVLFSHIASTLIYIAFKTLNLPYALYMSVFATLGTISATFISRWYERVSGRQSFIVWTLVFCFVLGTAFTGVFGTMNLMANHDKVVSITAFTAICPKKAPE